MAECAMVRSGEAWQGKARIKAICHGKVRLGVARPGEVRQGKEYKSWRGKMGLGGTGQGELRRGKARQGLKLYVMARQGQVGYGWPRHGVARQGKGKNYNSKKRMPRN